MGKNSFGKSNIPGANSSYSMRRPEEGMGSESERDLVVRARNGDLDALGELVSLYNPKLLGYAYGRLRRSNDAEDVVQTAWVKMLGRMGSLKDPARFSGWMFGIVRHCIVDQRRGERRIDVMDPVYFDEIPDTRLEPDATGDARKHAIRAVVERLPPTLQDIVRWRYYTTLSYAQIAAISGIGVALVKSRLHEAKSKLRELLPGLEEFLADLSLRLSSSKEFIVNKAKFAEAGAALFERLALPDRIELCKVAAENARFPEELLVALSRQPHGKEFVREPDGSISWDEFLGVLKYIDRYTEARFTEALSLSEPALAQKLRSLMFDKLSFLKTVPLLRKIDELGFLQVEAIASIREIAAGETIFHRNDEADALFVIVEGRLRVQEPGSDTGEIAVLGPQDFFGDVALLAAQPRLTTVQAVTDVTLIAIERSDFLNLIKRNGEIAVSLLQTVGERLRISLSN